MYLHNSLFPCERALILTLLHGMGKFIMLHEPVLLTPLKASFDLKRSKSLKSLLICVKIFFGLINVTVRTFITDQV